MMVGFDGENGLPSGLGLLELAQTVVVSSDLQAGIQMIAITANRCLKVRERVVKVIEMQVVQAPLMPCCCVFG